MSQIIINEQLVGDEDVDFTLRQLNLLVIVRRTTTTMMMNMGEDVRDNDTNDPDNNDEQATAISIAVSTHHFPPINQVGQVSDHDRPYAEYGHVGMLSFFLLFCFLLLLFHLTGSK